MVELYGKEPVIKDGALVGSESIILSVLAVENMDPIRRKRIWWNAWRDTEHGKGWRPMSEKLFNDLTGA